jgi:molybdenum cofactor cytidylyltransferase
MGSPKALLPVRQTGECFLTHLAGTLRDAGLHEVVVVLGADLARIQAVAEQVQPPLRVVVNRDFARGQLSSLVAALDVVDRPGMEAVVVVPVDVPLVAPATVRAILAAYARSHAPVVRPTFGGRHGHPVLFDRLLFPELRRADESQGARAVIRAHASAVLDVPVEDEGAFLDIDTPAEYERYVGVYPPPAWEDGTLLREP